MLFNWVKRFPISDSHVYYVTAGLTQTSKLKLNLESFIIIALLECYGFDFSNSLKSLSVSPQSSFSKAQGVPTKSSIPT